ncbi:winged helix DNA-binding protein [Halobaculum sp. WSA2]|uniref:Winged helix DNA-binding protein n=1 Tax=Halobaculum saliterrae TaxID=2073113 RepID=A0A6B0T033_9EURY|nr:metal-dependent transcriptional regulator [Halobaculum saliterrae]MXR43046.1 winged helix DNA-binding protein [Halobaculum saliterrae]
MLSAIMEDYLKVIYYLQNETNDRVRTSALAEYMDVEQSTITSMMKKLSDRDLVHYEPYQGVTLSDAGIPIALEIIRHHRLLERYLTDHLEYDWAEVHDEADRLEHHISSQFADRIAKQLGDPTVDPHGDPIPTADLDVSGAKHGDTLADHQVGDSVRIERVPDKDPALLRYLSEHRIRPGVVVEIIETTSFGMVTFELGSGDDTISLPEDVARSISTQSLTTGTN